MAETEGPALQKWLRYISSTHLKDIDMGLERVQKIALRMGLIPVPYKSVIVGGTNGKGSTCMAAAGILESLNYNVGITMSPHLISFNERIIINNNMISDDLACEGFAAIEESREEVPLTYFEFSALLALYCFYKKKVEVGIFEVGLGGRLDAFNIVDADIAVITSISLDHTEYLGPTVEAIGAEKAGIFRKNQNVVLGANLPTVVREKAEQLECCIDEFGKNFSTSSLETGFWSYRSNIAEIEGIERGPLASANTSLGLHVALLLDRKTEGNYVDEMIVKKRIRSLSLSGRMENIVAFEREFVFDVAHNPGGAAFLAAELKARYGNRKIYGVFGGLKDKDTFGIFSELDGIITGWYGIDIEGDRSLGCEDAISRIPDHIYYEPIGDVEEVFKRIISETEVSNVILVCGSFAVVEQVKAALMF